jgi:hypothetical protein
MVVVLQYSSNTITKLQKFPPQINVINYNQFYSIILKITQLIITKSILLF